MERKPDGKCPDCGEYLNDYGQCLNRGCSASDEGDEGDVEGGPRGAFWRNEG